MIFSAITEHLLSLIHCLFRIFFDQRAAHDGERSSSYLVEKLEDFFETDLRQLEPDEEPYEHLSNQG